MENQNSRLSEKEKRRRKLEFAELIERGEALRGSTDLDHNVMGEVMSIYERSNNLVERAPHPELMVLDARTLTIGMSLLKQNLYSINPNLATFETSVFCDKLLAYRVEKANPPGPEAELDWTCLADVAASCFKRSPTWTPMLGLLDQHMPPPQPKPRRVGKPQLGEKRHPEKVTALEAQNEGMEESIQAILKVIRKEFKRNGSQPICFFKLVINPFSYANTVQNIFHFSFLVKDGLVEMQDDPDGATFRISPVNLNASDAAPKKGSKQMVLSLNMATWKDAIQVYKITEAAIPSSAKATQPAPGSKPKRSYQAVPADTQSD